MLIKKLVLHNIRSYVDAEINFNIGKTLIAGDIGSGKSTILLAIEFALFGLMKGEISGNMLLRHGSQHAFVELSFEVNDYDVIIHRALKRTVKGIDQDTGYVIRNGLKTEMTSTELKALVLELLGYPADLLAKSKSLLFRYTVYTPQEDMKRILLGDNDERLGILRRVFGIDTYKRVTENAELYARSLREKFKELHGRTADLDEKKKQLLVIENELSTAQDLVQKNEPLLITARQEAQKARQNIVDIEAKKQEHQNILRTRDLCVMRIKQYDDEKTRLVTESTHIRTRITQLMSELNGITIDDSALLKQDIVKKTNDLAVLEKERLVLAGKNAGNLAVQKISNEIIDKIKSLAACPLCLQNVDAQHKEHIATVENTKINTAKNELAQNTLVQQELDAKIVTHKFLLDTLRMKEKSSELLLFKQRDYAEHSRQLDVMIHQLDALEKERLQLLEKKNTLDQQCAANTVIDENYARAKHQLDTALSQEKTVEITHNLLKEKCANNERNKKNIDAEIKEKEQYSARAASLKHAYDWIHTLFCPLVTTIEKQVLSRVYNEFNDLFRTWFGMLVEDELFSARLDDSFAPVLHQNGFDTLPENLSGGEKTACALAYRLALNKAINDIMTLVQTKDVLILDEPTDGFSDAQLDKVGDVLDHLGLKQVILVSHERKIEGFVDTILHISKTGHVSGVVQ